MRRPQSVETVSLKTLLVMLVFLKVSKGVLGCTGCTFNKTISTSEIIISGASDCTMSSSAVLQRNTPKGKDLHVSGLVPGRSYDLTLNCPIECCIQFTTKPDVIRGLTFSQITTSSVRLSWTAPQGNSSFYRVGWNNSAVSMNITTNETSVDITGLTAGAQYTFYIVAVAEDRLSEGGSVNETQYTRPNVIKSLSVTHVTTETVSLSWTEPEGNCSFYRVEWDDNTVPMNKTTNETSVDITGLTAGAQYVFRVVAVAADNQTAGDSVSETQYTRPDVIRNLSVTHITTETVSLNWTEPEGNSLFYRVEWDDSTVSVNKTTEQTSVVITGLTAGAQYVFRVLAVAADNQTAGDSVNKTQYTRPDVIRNLSVTHFTTETVSLNWTEPEGNSSFYRVEWDDNTVPVNKTTNETSVVITGLTAGAQYVFRVLAVAADNQTAGDSVNKTQYTRPNVIKNLSVTDVTTATVSLNWTEPEGNSSFYRVEWDDNTVSMSKTTNETSVVVTGLTAGAQYVFRVLAVAADNQTAGGSVSETQYTKPDVISNLSVTHVTTETVSLSWTAPQGNSSFYRVEWGESTVSMSKTTNETSVVITGLTAGAQYVFRVVAVAADNQTAGGSVSETQYTRPEKVVIVSKQTGNSSLGIAWEQLGKASATSYEVNLNLTNSAPQIQKNLSTTGMEANISGLSPGRIYDITVTSVAGSFKNTSDIFQFATKPNPPQSIKTNQTNYSISVTWKTPLGMDGLTGISYNISYQSRSDWNHISVSENNVTLSPLSPGTEYSITLETMGPQNLRSTSVHLPVYTAPDSPSDVKAVGTTTNMTVTWSSSGGSSYNVTICNSSAVQIDSRTVPSVQPVLFSNLRPGRLYNVSVFVLSGPHQKSEMITNATYPNPPKAIKVVEQTTGSINISWGRPLDMDLGQYSFTVFISSPNLMTADNWTRLDNLTSGTPYNISVVTVGPLGYQSMPVRILATTRPYPVRQLRGAAINTSSILLIWDQLEPKDGYTYNVTVAYPNGTLKKLRVNSTTVHIGGLQSGYNHTFTITTLAADGTAADPWSISLFTKPDPIGGLKAVTLNTTTVYLNWTRPQGTQSDYSYRVETTGCTSAPKNQSENRESAYVTDLRSGSNCTFTVYSRVGKDTEGKPVSTSQYTKPEKLTPTVSPGGNDSITVSWQTPKGTVEKYVVNLTSSDGESSTQELSSTVRSHKFSGLMAAEVYSVKLNTISGPFTEESEPVSNATYPNQPGQITLKERTTNFMFLEWGEAPGNGSFNYSVFYLPAANTTITQHCNTVNLSDLAPGTAYNISVSTVGPLGFTSLPVRIQVTTRPESVRSLEVNSTSAEEITVQWEATRYRYKVAAANSSDETDQTHYRVRNLTPGTQYTVNVTTLACDGTEGIQKSVTNCTDAAPVTDLSCKGPNQTDAVLVLSWSKPRGANLGFEVLLDNSRSPEQTNSSSHNVTDLFYNTEYNVMVWTLGCGKKSVVTEKVCKTGITAPPAPDTADVSITEKEHDKFTLRLSRALFNETHGPIVNYGVLVTSDRRSLSVENNSLLKTYLNKTYDKWTEGSTTTYLAILKDSESRKRNSGNDLVVVVGDGTKFGLYRNGPLTSKTYSFAVVTFTYLEIKDKLVSIEKSFFSISKFYKEEISLPVNPVVVGGAVGGTLGALLILFLATVIAAVCWKKLSEGKSSDVPIYSMRAKVSVPVKVENYEAYYKQHRADSNCGFAEQFENLKPVGVAQAKAYAIIPENKGKNRYNNVLPYDSSRVKLSVNGTPHDDYINANYMPGYNSRKEFIAAQGPLPSTLNEFWRMIWEKNVHTVVMLTRCNEQGRVKCEQYWPSGTQQYGNIAVKTASDIRLEDWTIRDFSVKNLKTAETRNVRQFHFTAWPDHGVPETTELLINFRHLVREHMDQYSLYSPTVVHCSAGVGRTGTFIAIDRLIFQIEHDSIVDVYGVVHDLRMHRPLMVQTEDQYVFLNQCALDIIRSRTGTNVDLIYQNTAALSIYENFEPMKPKNGYHNA
ncbi:receptor-type tyrosine-protein phosphatase eta-like isoform X4 [Anguilla anguilla]|uniref:receptor-type tyrosine-protein phosphatase eta-like isoform X4 n=1 Tax=Anguilla anguilla TaxID=7936 RepID=UPI0015AA2842|nr:receptor-type tyrosine-protein phosphatase eta-like isoform X4 [Anguilla anguilla]